MLAPIEGARTVAAPGNTICQYLCAPHEFRTTAFQAVLGHGQEKP